MARWVSHRRCFLAQSGIFATAVALQAGPRATQIVPFKISLAQWTINRELRAGKIDNLDFAKVARDHGIKAVEYVNQFFMDKARDKNYLGEMKQRAADLG